MRNLAVALCLLSGLGGPAAGEPLRARSTLLSGTVPSKINWQASLLFNEAPVSGPVSMTFRLYDALSGGNLLWDGGAQTVTCSAGFCSTALSPSLTAISGGAAYLEVTIGGTALSPRASFNGVPYALMAKGVEGSLEITGGGLSISSVAFGSSVLFVSSNTGMVGIGISAPAYRLDVQGDIRSTGTVMAASISFPSGSLTSVPLIVGTNLAVNTDATGMGTSSPDQKLTVAGAISLTGIFVSSGTGISYFAGNVGIQTTSPASKLHVLDGDITISTTLPVIRGIYFPDGSFMNSAAIGSAASLVNAGDAAVQANAGAVRLRTGLADKAVITNSGSVGIGTTQPSTALEAAGSAQFGSGASKSTFTAAGSLQLVAGSTLSARGTLSFSPEASLPLAGQAAVFFSTGNVGIGTSRPAVKLHSAGDINSDGTFYVGGGTAVMRAVSSSLIELGSEASGGPAARFVAGSAVPIITITAGGNVGFSSAAPNAPFVVADGTMVVTALGRVGLAVVDPQAKLHLSSSTLLIDGTAPWADIANATFFSTAGKVGIGTSNPQSLLQIGATTLAAQAGGNVGIGTTSPGARLEVAGSVIIGSGTARSRVSSGGNLAIAGNVQVTKGAILNGGPFLNDPSAAVMTVEAAPTLATSNQPGVSISGNLFAVGGSSVGIGTASPSSRLNVSSGTLLVDGTGAGLSVGQSNLAVRGANVGVGTALPGTVLHLSSGVLTIDGTSPRLHVDLPTLAAGKTNTGIGTASPSTKLHLNSGVLLIDGTSPGLAVGATTFVVSGGQVGVGTLQPAAALDVLGAARFGLSARPVMSAEGNLQMPSGSRLGVQGSLTISTAATAAKTGLPALFIDGAGRVDIGTAAPNALLTVGSSFGGTAHASSFTVNAGALGAGGGADLGLASFGFTSSNNSSFGVRATRASAGADWTTSAVSLGMDVDGTLDAGATVWLSANGNVGVGDSSPASLLTAKNGDFRLKATGGLVGIFFGDGSYQTTTGGGPSQWAVSATNLYSANVGNVGVGVAPPAVKLHVGFGGQVELDLQNTVTGGTPLNGSHWGLFADNGAGAGAGGNLTLGFYDVTNTTLRMGIDNSGQLGVGTTEPGAVLDVAGTATTGIRYLRSAADARLAFGDLTSTWTVSSGRFVAGDFALVSEALPPNGLYIKQGGNIGIGATNPFRLLSVLGGSSAAETLFPVLRTKGAGSSTAATLRFANDTSDTTNGAADLVAVRTNATNPGDGDLFFRTAAGGVLAEDVRFKADGKLGIGTTNPAGASHILGANANQLYLDNTGQQYTSIYLRNNGIRKGSLFWDDTGSSLYLQSNVAGSLLRMGVNGGNNLNINSSGQVGMGTTSPDTGLTCVGDGSGLARVGSGSGCGGNYTGLNLNGLAFVGCTNYNFLSSPTDTNLYINRATGGGILMRENNSDQLTTTSGGSVGVGTNGPGAKLQVVGDIRVGTSGTNGCLQRFNAAAIAGSCSSDERLKKNILPITGALGKLSKFRPVTYEWRIDEFPERRFGPGKSFGLLAQEVEKVLPELVGMDDKGFRTVSYGVELKMLMVQSVRELKAEREAMQDVFSRKLHGQKVEFESLEKRWKELQSCNREDQP